MRILHILGVEHRHSGEIQCIVYNSLNPVLTQRSCYTDLAVLARPVQLANVNVDPDAGSFFVNTTTVHCTDLNPNTSQITQQAFKPIADVPAYLIRGPDDCTALIGGTVCLTVTYGGYPKPSVKWLRAVSSFSIFLTNIFFVVVVSHFWYLTTFSGEYVFVCAIFDSKSLICRWFDQEPAIHPNK